MLDLLPVGGISIGEFFHCQNSQLLITFLFRSFQSRIYLPVRPTRADFSFVLNIALADYSAEILN